MSKAGVPITDTSVTIRAAGIHAGETIVIDYGEISIKVKKPSGQLIIVKVDPDNKVKTIRDAIKEAEQIAITGYSLKFNGQVLDEEKTIAAAGLQGDDTVTMDYAQITIYINGLQELTKNQLAKALVKVCEFDPNQNAEQYQINNCAALYKGALTG
jgi:phage gp45-like